MTAKASFENFPGRIIAAWSHAAPDNWGARRWDVKITSFDVSDDGDTGSDGDWRFWVNTNNGDSEWAKLFDCGGRVHGNMTTLAPLALALRGKR